MRVGKKSGKSIYIHRSAVDTLPPHLWDRFVKARDIVYDMIEQREVEFINMNFVIIHPDYVELVHAENFMTMWEPVLGKRYRVDNGGIVTFIPRPAKPRVLHQRYKTVEPDYTGFSIQADKNRERWYRKYFDARRMAGAGYLHKWIEMLAEIDKRLVLRLDNE
jgi:hypothetical protein